jgi:hypothetical protein
MPRKGKRAENLPPMGREHERFLQKTPVACACGRKLADPLISNPQSRDGRMENDGLKSEVLWVSKLDWARIIPAAEKNIEKDEVARSLTQPIMDAQRQVIIFFLIFDLSTGAITNCCNFRIHSVSHRRACETHR